MRYFILGYMEDGRLIFMTSRVFASLENAKVYLKEIAPAWKPFIVGEVK